MKKIMMLLLNCVLCLSLLGCGSDPKENPDPKPQNPDNGNTRDQEIVVCGNEVCGYLTLDIYPHIIKVGSNEKQMVEIYARNCEVIRVRIEPLTFTEKDPDFDFAARYLHDRYYNARNGDEKIYSEEQEAYITLDGQPAYRVTAERDDRKERCEKIVCAGYITTNAGGDFIHIKIEAPKNGTMNDGTYYPPSISELMDMVERTFSRTKND